MIASERPVEAHVLARHVASHARTSRAIRIVVSVLLQALAIGELGVASRAGRVAGRRGERAKLLPAVGTVRVVAARAGHRSRAPAEQEVACLARVDVAAPSGSV